MNMLRAKQNELLPDSDSAANVNPHPDGRAWRKACGECAFRVSDPQHLGDRYQTKIREFDGESVFYCVHRQDGENNRICACYAAINGL
jgi:hypothetical protein